MNEICHNCKWYHPLTPRSSPSECTAFPPVHFERTNTWIRPRVFVDTAACRFFEKKDSK